MNRRDWEENDMNDAFTTTTTPDTAGKEWVICPGCGRKKIMRLLPDTVGKSVAVYCRLCRRAFALDIQPNGRGHNVISREIDRG